jgi:hypothetical protein
MKRKKICIIDFSGDKSIKVSNFDEEEEELQEAQQD